MHSSKSTNPFEFHRKLGVDTYKNIFKLIEHLKKGKEEIKDFYFFFPFQMKTQLSVVMYVLRGEKIKTWLWKRYLICHLKLMLDFFCSMFSFNLLTALLVSDAGRGREMAGLVLLKDLGFGVSHLRAGPCESLGQDREPWTHPLLAQGSHSHLLALRYW